MLKNYIINNAMNFKLCFISFFTMFCVAVVVIIFNAIYKNINNQDNIRKCFSNRAILQDKSLECSEGIQCDMYKFALAQYKCEDIMLSLSK